jgi:hypothetical protein
MFASPEISALIPPTDPDVLHWNEERRVYEISPSSKSIRERFLKERFYADGLRLCTAKAHVARSVDEWELFADPDTYTRLKTR